VPDNQITYRCFEVDINGPIVKPANFYSDKWHFYETYMTCNQLRGNWTSLRAAGSSRPSDMTNRLFKILLAVGPPVLNHAAPGRSAGRRWRRLAFDFRAVDHRGGADCSDGRHVAKRHTTTTLERHFGAFVISRLLS